MNRRRAAEALLDQLRREAVHLAPGDLSTQDELVQHMATAIVSSAKKFAAIGYFAKLARCRALDWLRQEKKRTCPELKTRAHQKSERL